MNNNKRRKVMPNRDGKGPVGGGGPKSGRGRGPCK